MKVYNYVLLTRVANVFVSLLMILGTLLFYLNDCKDMK